MERGGLCSTCVGLSDDMRRPLYFLHLGRENLKRPPKKKFWTPPDSSLQAEPFRASEVSMETPRKPKTARVEITTPVREQFLRDALEATNEDGRLLHGFMTQCARKLDCGAKSPHKILNQYRKDLSECSSLAEPPALHARGRGGVGGRENMSRRG